MKYLRYWLVATLGLLLAAVLTVAALGSRQELGPAYSVKALQMNLQQAPRRWVGRTVRVRGVAWPCREWAYGPCLRRTPYLASYGADPGLALARQPANPLLAVVRALPLIGSLVLPRQILHWGVLASYRVQIRAVPAASCSYWPCYEALLLDPAPGAP
jgi:hypothetical protein